MFYSSTPLPPALERLVQRFQQTSDPKRKYEHLLWLTKRLPEFPAAAKIANNKVPGCVSQVYITATLEDDKVTFQGDSDAQITKGLVALLIEGLSSLSPLEIQDLSPDFITATRLDVSLTPSRANGFYNIFQFMQHKATTCQFANMPSMS
ncbi:MAG: Cysteine desulfuration protein SufE [Chroococcidiopsis sp. SAG 2025]|uniref:SufE family protein n=1 Tax=Chroococcidiopsis sp. SAG 2025 TaxID=171389 RepID=UPI0029372C22|nr:SufE family protein [Chroococcidiopsis sp. SAG 2025]MDV2994785.1 Cysteine desulfuration protein SufE [Chroococcidiopsis sp. SAG 2025]